MEQDTPRLLIAHFIGDAPKEGEVIDEWPSHVTLVKPFSVAEATNTEEVVEAISSVTRLHRPLTLTPIGYEMFGPPEDIERQAMAIKVRRTEELHKLHLDLVRAIEGFGIVFSDRRWMAETYNPHSTIKGGAELREPALCDSLTISAKEFGRVVMAKTVSLG